MHRRKLVKIEFEEIMEGVQQGKGRGEIRSVKRGYPNMLSCIIGPPRGVLQDRDQIYRSRIRFPKIR